jgi:galactose mutarotase-like enzyme
MLYTLQNSSQSLTIESLGSQIMSWQLDSQDIFYTSANPKRCGMPLMFPYCGPLKDGIFDISGKPLGQHVFGRVVDWKLGAQTVDSITFKLKSTDLDVANREAFPFEFEGIFGVSLLVDGIHFSLCTKNLGSSKMPIAPGFHPYFAIQNSLKDHLQIYSKNWKFNSKLMPWSTGLEAQFNPNPVEFEVEIPTLPKLLFKDLSYLSVAGKKVELPCDLLTIWAGEVADFVCIEPMSKRFDSINIDPIWVEPGGEYCLQYQIVTG